MKKVIAIMILFIIGIGLSNAKADVIKDGIAEVKYDYKAFKEETVPAMVSDVKALPGKGKDFCSKSKVGQMSKNRQHHL